MSEKEKMISGLPYFPEDQELTGDRLRAKKLCHRYNKTSYDDTPNKKLLNEIFLKEVDGHIEPDFWCDYGYNITIGSNFYANHGLVILDSAPVTIGDNVFLGPNLQIYTPTHPLDYPSRNTGIESAKGVTIGSNVWMGGGCIILPGVTIGDDVVVGAGSVVTKDIPNGSVVGGNPAKFIKKTSE